MKRFTQIGMMLFLIVCAVLAAPRELKAEKAASAELAELLGIINCICYDCGSGTEDGVLEFRSDAQSLKEGDIVDVQLVFHPDKDNVTGGATQFEFFLTHDTDVLEYVDMIIEDAYKIKYMPSITMNMEEDGGRDVSFFFTRNQLEDDGCLVTMQYKVKKSVPATKIYADTVMYGNHKNYKKVYLYDHEISNTITWTDVFTVEVKDSTPSSSLLLSSAPAQGEKEITVPINIKTNSGFNLLGLEITYDTSLFTYESLDIDNALQSKISLDSIYEAPGSGNIKASFLALEDISDTGNFLKLKLKTKDGVPAGTVSNVGIGIAQVGNKAETDIQGTGTTCAVSITGTSSGEGKQPTLGDVNGDSNINLTDAVYILQYYNQAREFSDMQKTAADVDKNGTADLVDALMIMKYFNGEITGF